MAFPLINRIRHQADQNPMAPALISADACITYGELATNLAILANHFEMLHLPRLGKAFLNIAHPDLRLAVFLAAIDYGLIPLVAQPDTVKADFSWDFVVGSPAPVWAGVLPDVVIDNTVLAGRFADARRRQFVERADEELSYVAETSGTTGRPKLVAVSHKAHCEFFELRWRRRFARGDRITSSTGGANKYGIRLSESVLYEGATMVTVPVEASAALRLINLFNTSYLLTTPTYIERAIDLMDAKNIRCPSINEIQLTGATFDPDLLRRIESRFAARIFVGYGTSEIEAGGIARGKTSSSTYTKGYVGQINPDLKLVVTGTRANPGPVVIVNDGDQFTRSIVQGKIVRYDAPFYTVPDIGYVEDSILYLAGRADEVFNNGGNIKAYSLIAEEVARLDRVKDVAIVGAASLGNDKDIVIGVVANQPLNLEGFPRRLAERLLMAGAEPHFKIVQLAEIKRDQQTGKVDRAALIRDYQALNGVGRETWATGSIAENSRARG